jgi:hypothetical protein
MEYVFHISIFGIFYDCPVKYADNWFIFSDLVFSTQKNLATLDSAKAVPEDLQSFLLLHPFLRIQMKELIFSTGHERDGQWSIFSA